MNRAASWIGIALLLTGCITPARREFEMEIGPPAEVRRRLDFWVEGGTDSNVPVLERGGKRMGGEQEQKPETEPDPERETESEPEQEQELEEKRGADVAGEPADPALEEDVLTLPRLVQSVEAWFPLIEQLEQERIRAEADRLSAEGAFDPLLRSEAKYKPYGFFENERVDTFVEQATPWWGTSFVGGYRIGQGDFDEYDQGDQTNSGGEFRAGLRVPLLQGGAIDERRLGVFRADLGRLGTDSEIRDKRIELFQKATFTYWRWVAAGQRRELARRLLRLAVDRQNQLSGQVDEGLLPPIILVDNERLIVEREADLIVTERGLEAAALALSLFLRDEQGLPDLPDESRLPEGFPPARLPAEEVVDEDVQLARDTRPDVRFLEVELERLELELQGLENQLLPKLDFEGFVSQDLGNSSSSVDDKSEFELELGLKFEVPLGQRAVRGKVRAGKAKLRKAQVELQFLREQVEIQLRDAFSAWRQAYARLQKALSSVELALQVEQGERELMSEGDSDLLRVNLREQQTARDASQAIDAAVQYLLAVNDYRAAIGIDPGVLDRR